MLNQLLVGRYLVTEVLGEGGLAKTYIAIDQHKPSRPQCVVKILKPASKDSSFLHIARRLFNTEAKILDKLGKHSQIPQLLAYFEENKEFFIIQEYIAGHTLSTELPTGHRWTENKVILMLQDVLETLAFVHDSRVIHRDLKPNNLIRRDQDGKIVLIDFGAVKQVGDARITTKMPLTPKTISIGTQGYMPLEQARGKPKFNSDIYSLGMTAIQALTGTDPFHLAEGADGEVIWRDYAAVSDKLATILTQMVRYNFTNRYQSVSEVQQALATLDHSVVLSQVTSGDKQQGGSSSDAELRETRVSLENKLLEIEKIDSTVSGLESIEDTIPPPPPVEPKETKVSLRNGEDLDQVNTIPEAKTAKKQPRRDSWSTWDLDTSPPVKPHNTSTKIDQIESRDSDPQTKATKLDKNDSWNLLNSAPVAKSQQDLSDKPVNNKQVDQIASVQVNPKKPQTIQDSAPKNPAVNLPPEGKETRISLGNKPVDDASSLLNFKETRLSLSNEQNSTHSASEVAAKETKISEDNHKFETAFSVADSNETKAAIDNKIKASPLSIARDKINQLNISALTRQISLPLEHIKLDQVAIAISSAASSTSQYLSNIKPSLVSAKNNKYALLIGSGVSLTAIAFYFGSKHFTDEQKYTEAKIALQEIETLKTTKKYQECIQQAQAETDNLANFNIDITSLIKDCSQGQLNAAKKLAKASRYKDAINLATVIPREQDIYTESQELITQWSNKIYNIATNKYNEGNLEQAIAILKAIPENSPVASKIQSTIKQWEENWQLNKSYIQTAQKKLDQKQWQDVINEAKKVKENPYWLKQSKELITKAESAIAAPPVPRRTYNPRTRAKVRTRTRTRTTPRTNTYSRPAPSKLAPLPPKKTPLPTIPTTQSGTKVPSVCSNKNSRIPKCKKYR